MKNLKTFLTTIFYWWSVPILLRGKKAELQASDLPPVRQQDSTGVLGSSLKLYWDLEKKESTPSLWRAMRRMFGRRYLVLSILLVFHQSVLKLAVPLLTGILISYITAGKRDEAYWIVVLLVFITLLGTILVHWYYFAVQILGMNIRVALMAIIYDKLLVLRMKTTSAEGIGQLTNILTNDLNRFIMIHNVPFIISGPIQLIMMGCILWTYTGPSCLAGIVVLVTLIPTQGAIGKRVGQLRGKMAAATDKRLRVLGEMIDGMLMVKMNAWENLYEGKIQSLRGAELKVISAKNLLSAFNYAVYNIVGKSSVLFTLLAYILLGNTLTTEAVFVTLSVYNTVAFNLAFQFPTGITLLAELIVAIRRVKRILLLDEIPTPELDIPPSVSTPPRIVLTNMSAKWTNEADTLVDINLTACKGELIGIVGPVGGGKSSILQVIHGELPAADPSSVTITGSIAYAPQEPWLFSESVRNNILCGRSFNQALYDEVVDACGLKPDLAQLTFGDESLIGDRGVTLSGGQQARVNLARAVYSGADVVLLDDPLSALDVRVAQHVKEKCIDGLLRSKCVILVTHQTHYLRQSATEVIYIENGRIVQRKSAGELCLDIDGGESAKTLDDIQIDEEVSEPNVNGIECVSARIGYGTFDGQPQKSIEIRRVGNIGWKLLLTYFRIGNSYAFLIFALTLSVVTQAIMNGSDMWLKAWSDAESNPRRQNISNSNSTHIEHMDYLWTYALMVVILFIFCLVQVNTIFHVVYSSSKNLHQKLLKAIIKAPQQFFDDTKGLTLKLFSNDIGITDDGLTLYTFLFIMTFTQVLGAMVLIVIIGSILLIPLLIYILLIVFLVKIYMHPSATMKRLESLAQTPVVGHLCTTITGITVIRAAKAQEFFRNQFTTLQDAHTSIFYTSLGSSRWIGVCIELLSDLYIACVIFYFILISASPSFVGLAISTAMTLAIEGTAVLVYATFVANQIVSVERLLDYSELKPEEHAGRRGYLEKRSSLKSQWPSTGHLRFDNVSVSHRGGPNVLQGVTAHIRDGEKVGIIGRTGAGKTSLISTLFRIINSNSGYIHIDGVDIQKLTLRNLRLSLSIIQQNPLLMAGTLRQNLDPHAEFRDDEIWRALDSVQFEAKNGKMGLESLVSERGSNFSQGEKQLISLARTILKQSKIVVLDEATSNIDSATDAIIQRTLREQFRTSTILTVAHRLETVMDSDKILVIDGGKIKEFDAPSMLLRNQNSYLYRLVQKTGPANAARLLEQTKMG